MKQCRTCKEFKSEEEFYDRGNCVARPNRRGKDTECKICFGQRSRKNSSSEKRRYNRVHLKFGLSKKEYDQLIKDFPICGICNNEFRLGPPHFEPHVDHCHTTNKVRGLLCNECNKGLGWFRDNSTNLTNAAQYIIKSLAADCPN